MAYLKKHGARLGGNSGQRFLRLVGFDAFILTNDVVTALQHAGIDVADTPTSQRDLRKAQDAMNALHAVSELPYAHLSRILSCSVGKNYAPEVILGH